jgi:hypothetical protein
MGEFIVGTKKLFYVKIEFHIDPNEYEQCKPTEAGVKELVQDMIQGLADYPEDLTIEVE